MPVYVKYGDMKGSVTAEGHVGWIDISSLQWGVGRGIRTPTGNAANREAGAPSASEVTVTKKMDLSSFRWLDEALQGRGVDCVIHFCKTDQSKLDDYAEYKLANCLVSGYSVASGGDRPDETISLNFTRLEFAFEEQGLSNTKKDTPRLSYDVATAKVS